MKTNHYLLCIVALSAILFHSCIPSPDVKVNFKNDLKDDSLLNDTTGKTSNLFLQSIEYGKATHIFTKIVFPAGRIRVSSSEKEFMKGEFKFSNKEWKPEILYTEEGDTGNITIEPRNRIDNINFNDNDTCRWFIGLNPEKKYSMEIQAGACKGDINLENFNLLDFNFALGAGQVNINLKNTSVPKLEISVGAGKATVDLTGTWKNNLEAKIAGGVGEIEVHLPKEVDVKAEVNGLLGGVEADGFIKRGNKYINSTFGKADYALHLEIDGAIGKVKLIRE